MILTIDTEHMALVHERRVSDSASPADSVLGKLGTHKPRPPAVI